MTFEEIKKELEILGKKIKELKRKDEHNAIGDLDILKDIECVEYEAFQLIGRYSLYLGFNPVIDSISLEKILWLIDTDEGEYEGPDEDLFGEIIPYSWLADFQARFSDYYADEEENFKDYPSVIKEAFNIFESWYGE